ncbi:MAG: VWA domain-containing protein [Candidatus Acidiferrum sp.]
MRDRLKLLLVFFSLVCVTAGLAQTPPSAPATQPTTGEITLDVVVTPKSGPPVSGLQQQDFTITENKVPQTITAFQAFRGREAPVDVILVIDDVNTGIEHVAYERSEIDKFLKLDGGHLSNPMSLAFVTDSGIKLQEGFTSDGNSLVAALDQYTLNLHTILRSGGIYSAEERLDISMKSIFGLATHEAARPGRKLIIWLSPGWPLLSGPGVQEQIDNKQQQQIFNDVVLLSNLMRQGRITLYSIDPLGAADFGTRAFWWQEFTKGIDKPSQAEWGNLALQVLAVQSGGLALTTGNDITAYLQQCVADAQAYYQISFIPSLEQKKNEAYHRIEVRVDKGGTTVRTRQGYYDQSVSPSSGTPAKVPSYAPMH